MTQRPWQGLVAYGSDSEPLPSAEDPLAASTVLDLDEVQSQPSSFDRFDFRPHMKKLILAGAAETERIAPPSSGHEITDSSGFFLLSYAAPPDFASTDLSKSMSR